MPQNIFQKGLKLLFRRQTNIISAAFIIMSTVIFSQLLGLIRQRLLVTIFGASNTVGVYLYATKLPDLLFQLIIAGALFSAFIPVYSDFIEKKREKEANVMASTLLAFWLIVFFGLSVVLFLFAPFFLQVMNLGEGFTLQQMELMANLTRVILFAQLLFIIGTFFSAILQSYNHFFIPGIAAAFYNVGIICGIIAFSPFFGIYSAAFGGILGAMLFVLIQWPMIKKVGFCFKPLLSLGVPGVAQVIHLMWPRTISLGIIQFGTIIILIVISYLPSAGRNYTILDYAQTLAFAPILLFGQAIAQAAFPVLSRERERIEDFKLTFVTSFHQLLYLILPVSILFIVLRIPIVRLIYGAGLFDWQATLLTGRTLAYFSIGMFAQALIYLVSRAFYALHDTKTPLIVGTIATTAMIAISISFISLYRAGFEYVAFPFSFLGLLKRTIIFSFGIESIALASSIGAFLHFSILMIFLNNKVNRFEKGSFFYPGIKIFIGALLTAFALYIPIQLLDQVIVDTTRTVGLIFLTGVSSFAGLSIYLFLTWLFNVREATMFVTLFRKLGNWKEILGKSEEIIEPTRLNP